MAAIDDLRRSCIHCFVIVHGNEEGFPIGNGIGPAGQSTVVNQHDRAFAVVRSMGNGGIQIIENLPAYIKQWRC